MVLLLYQWFFMHDYVMLCNSVGTSMTTWFLCAYQCLCTYSDVGTLYLHALVVVLW